MNTILHSTRKDGIIEYDPSVPCLVDTHYGFLTSEEFRSHLTVGLNLLIEKKRDHHDIGWLADLKRMAVLTLNESDIDWMRDWYAVAFQHGIKYMATVIPEEELIKLAYDDVYQVEAPTIISGVINRNFTNIDEARKWLMNILKSGR